jgi:hypothetical protein
MWDELQEDEAKKQKKIDEYNKSRLQFRAKYGLDKMREQLKLELEAFDESELSKTLTTEEQEKARANIRRKYYKEYIDEIIDTAQRIADSLFEMEGKLDDRKYTNKIKVLEDHQEKELSVLKSRLDRGEIYEMDYNRKVDAINKKYEQQREAMERNRFIKEKQRDIARTIINGIVAIAKTFAETGFADPAGWIMAGIGAAMTAVQVATINAVKYAAGGIVEEETIKASRGWRVRGQGTSYSDSVPARLSYDEAVINARSMRNPALRAAASAINVAGGGVAFADGGMLGRSLTGTDSLLLTEKGMGNIMRKLPRPVVSVVDIISGINNYTEITNKADI